MGEQRRTYLVVIDDSRDARVALRFAALRASNTFGAVEVLAIVEPQDFVQWGGVQARIEEEQRHRIEGEIAACLGEIPGGTGFALGAITISEGEPAEVVRKHLAERPDIAALVVGAAPSGAPGALVAAFSGADAGKLPCPVMIIPGGLSDARLAELS